MEKVAAKIPPSWHNFGICLGIEDGKLRAIEQSYPTDQLKCFFKVYSTWNEEKLRPLTWEVVVEILMMKTLSQRALGLELAKEYTLHVI